jgi:hypothetical protein
VSEGAVRCFDRRPSDHDYHYPLRPTAQCINGRLRGQYNGLRVDGSQNAWLTDHWHNDLSGPFQVR